MYPLLSEVYYFASPYSSPDAYIKELRYLQAIDIATQLIKKGYTLIEPIAMSHHHAQRFDLPTGYQFWQERDRKLIDCSDAVIVCMLEGWDKSVGVKDEINYALVQNKPVYYYDPDQGLFKGSVWNVDTVS